MRMRIKFCAKRRSFPQVAATKPVALRSEKGDGRRQDDDFVALSFDEAKKCAILARQSQRNVVNLSERHDA
jgi:hypothetical protein